MPFVKNDPNINRNGRPPGKTLTTKVKEALAEYADGGNGKTYEQLYIKAILKKAIVDQDPTIMKILWNYYDGMPSQKIEANIEGELNTDISDEKVEAIINAYANKSRKDSSA